MNNVQQFNEMIAEMPLKEAKQHIPSRNARLINILADIEPAVFEGKIDWDLVDDDTIMQAQGIFFDTAYNNTDLAHNVLTDVCVHGIDSHDICAAMVKFATVTDMKSITHLQHMLQCTMREVTKEWLEKLVENL